jgi:hypothetical protein
MINSWKNNWPETKQNFKRWWNQEGLVIGSWGGTLADTPHDIIDVPPVVSPEDEAFYADIEARIGRNHFFMANQRYLADILPVANTSIGPGSLALHLGSAPKFTRDSVWYLPTMNDIAEPEKLPPLQFDPLEKWWRIQEQTLRLSVAVGQGKYITGCPDLVENIDVLASLRGTTTLLIDMVERPDWVDLYRRILDAGKSIQAYFVVADEIVPLLDAIGGKGVYVLGLFANEAEVESTLKAVEQFR